RGTTTTTGLRVRAVHHRGEYSTGESVSNVAMASLSIRRHEVCRGWNYTIAPRSDQPDPK
ncbi:MAG: ISAzo13 family transposase, partial [Planctomycetota bacterium]